jgi:hypothetical protein
VTLLTIFHGYRAGAVRLVGCVGVAFALLIGGAGSARAAGASWLPGQRIESGQASINGLSCPSVSTCVAASSSPIVQDGGPSFEPDPDPDPLSTLNAVSCAPGTHFCMFVDNNGGAFSYTDGSFGQLTNIDGNTEINDVSCPSSGFCMAIDHNHSVFKYSGGSWSGPTTLTVPGYTNFVNISCASSSFCVAMASASAEEAFTWNGITWSSAGVPVGPAGAYTVSLSCTSTNFCLDTDSAGNASVYNGVHWTTQAVDTPMNISAPLLHSACVGTSCVGVDFYDNFVQTSDGSTWTQPVNIKSDTSIAAVYSVACATATLCVAGDGLGDATTYTVPLGLGTPSIAGTGTVGQTLALTHAAVAVPGAWYSDAWFRCDNPDATCTIDPISTSTTGYTLVADDAGEYIDARETVGFGFDEEGFLAGDHLVSNIVGPIGDGSGNGNGNGGTPQAGTAKRTGSVSALPRGVVTISLACAGGACKGTAALVSKTKIGSANYSIADGKTGKITIRLNTAGKKLLKKHHGQLKVKLVITPTGGKPVTTTITLRVKS